MAKKAGRQREMPRQDRCVRPYPYGFFEVL